MIWIIWATVFLASFLFAYGAEAAWEKRNRVKVRAGEQGSSSTLLRSGEKGVGLQSKLMDMLAASGQWIMPDIDKITVMRRELIQAGFRSPRAPAIYLGFRIFAVFSLTLPFFLYLTVKGTIGGFSLIIAFTMAMFAFFLPAKFLSIIIRHRQERLDKSLPDILDMYVICMEAGLSLNASLHRVAEEIRGVYKEFAEELQITAGELRAGIPWAEAFDNMGKRTDVQSIRSMVGLMIQSNKLGASISVALRHHGDFIRTQRILRADDLPLNLLHLPVHHHRGGGSGDYPHNGEIHAWRFLLRW
jgi:tight adherence protein C